MRFIALAPTRRLTGSRPQRRAMKKAVLQNTRSDRMIVRYPTLKPSSEPASREYTELGSAGRMMLTPRSRNRPSGAQMPMSFTALCSGAMPYRCK